MGIEAEKAVEIDEVRATNADAGTGCAVAVVAVRDDHVEAVGSAAKEDDDQRSAGIALLADKGGELGLHGFRKIGMPGWRAAGRAARRRK